MSSIIFLGDIASPNKKCSEDLTKSLYEIIKVFEGKAVIANLEGLISNVTFSDSTPVLYNDKTVLNPLKNINIKAVTLANNHTLDLPLNFENTDFLLNKNGVAHCGAGKTESDAEQPARFTFENKEILVFGYCWSVLMQHQKNKSGKLVVNTIKHKAIINQIREVRKENPDSIIILKMHWNFDLETLPFPMHRQFSRDIIDSGANAVIGSHSHCVQGGERYKDGIVFYGLGNFFIPWYTYIRGTIHFPDISRQTVGLEWDMESGNACLHWFWYDIINGDHKLIYQGKEDFETSMKLLEFSPYQNLNNKEYVEFFRKNRRKKFLLPVYRDYNETIRNKAIDIYLVIRIRFARLLSKLKLREWNN